MKPDEAKNKITGPPLPNNEIMDALRKWKRRPGSCKDQVLIGVFEVDSCRAAEATCAQVIGIHVGDLVAVSLHTPTGDSEGADYEWIVATATRDVADVLEELADRNDRGPVLVQLRGFGVYTYKVDYPNLETGEMQYVRDPCPALLIESAQIRGYAADVLNH